MTDCYYYRLNGCSDETWECVSCHELYCDEHGHTSMMGANIECVFCERERLDHAAEEAQAQEPECYADCEDQYCPYTH